MFPGVAQTPKHLLLPMTVKSLTGNAELVTLLNRFGHGLSYSQIEELETAIAEQQKQISAMVYCCRPHAVPVFLPFSVGITMTFRRRLYQVSKEKDKLSFLHRH